MTDSGETLAIELTETPVPSSGNGLLDAIYQRWLDRTEGGDGKLIAATLSTQMKSGLPDLDALASLFDGHIALIGMEYVGRRGDESAVYGIGKRAVQGYIESSIAESKTVEVIDAIDAIEAAFRPDMAPPEVNSKPIVPAKSSIRRPERSPDEIMATRYENLQRAVEVKKEQGAIRAGLRKGELSLAEALYDPSAENMTIADLLIRVPKVGKARQRATLQAVDLAPETPICAITDSQRSRIMQLLPPDKHKKDIRGGTAKLAQSMERLNHANYIRIHRAGLKRKLASREVSVEELLDDEIAAGMKLGQVLRSLPTQSRSKKAKRGPNSKKLMDVVLSETGLRSDKPCTELTERQRQLLLDCLSARDNGEIYSITSTASPL